MIEMDKLFITIENSSVRDVSVASTIQKLKQKSLFITTNKNVSNQIVYNLKNIDGLVFSFQIHKNQIQTNDSALLRFELILNNKSFEFSLTLKKISIDTLEVQLESSPVIELFLFANDVFIDVPKIITASNNFFSFFGRLIALNRHLQKLLTFVTTTNKKTQFNFLLTTYPIQQLSDNYVDTRFFKNTDNVGVT